MVVVIYEVLNTICFSASITSDFIRMAAFQPCLQSGKQMTIMLFLVKKIPPWKRKCETVRCRDATSSSFVTKVQGEVFTQFHAVTIKHHSSMQNCLFGRPGQMFLIV
jgi:hypothetical protein